MTNKKQESDKLTTHSILILPVLPSTGRITEFIFWRGEGIMIFYKHGREQAFECYLKMLLEGDHRTSL